MLRGIEIFGEASMKKYFLAILVVLVVVPRFARACEYNAAGALITAEGPFGTGSYGDHSCADTEAENEEDIRRIRQADAEAEYERLNARNHSHRKKAANHKGRSKSRRVGQLSQAAPQSTFADIRNSKNLPVDAKSGDGSDSKLAIAVDDAR